MKTRLVDRQIQEWSEDLLERLIAVPSVSGHDTGIGQLLIDVLDELGYTVEEVDVAIDPDHPEHTPVPDGSIAGPALVARHSAGGADGAGYLLFAHGDTEPVSEGWSVPAHGITVSGGRAYGIGAADDKGGIVSILAAVRALINANALPDAPPVIAIAPAKYGGSLGMLQAVAASSGVRRAIYCHPAESGAGLGQIKVASRGIATVRVIFPGCRPTPTEERTPVSADPRTGHNAAYRAARFAAAVPRWQGFKADPTAVWSVTRLRTPDGHNFEMPDQAAVQVACWFTSGTVEDVHEFVEQQAIQVAETRWEVQHPPTSELVGLRANPAENRDEAYIQKVQDVVADVCGNRPEPYDWHSASDIRFPMRMLGVPTIGFGALGGGFYGADEWVDLKSVHQVSEIISRLLGTPTPQMAVHMEKGRWSDSRGGVSRPRSASNGGPRWQHAATGF